MKALFSTYTTVFDAKEINSWPTTSLKKFPIPFLMIYSISPVNTSSLNTGVMKEGNTSGRC